MSVTGAIAQRNKWYVETLGDGQINMISIDALLYVNQSSFQHVEIMRLAGFGTTLVLDDKIQSSEFDEHVYHETLVHPAMLAHPNPRTVFIGGGGEGATAREVLRHKTVEKLVMVDIDGECVKMCQEHLPHHNAGAFADPRMHLVIDDAKVQIEQTPDGTYDVIIMDLADPLPDGPCWQLYTRDFYETCKRKLTPGGVLITQSGPAGLGAFKQVFSPVNRTFRELFTNVEGYRVHVPSFCDLYGFNMASDAALRLSPEEIDQRIADRVDGVLRHIDGETIVGQMILDKATRMYLRNEDHVITAERPAFML